MGQVDRRDTQQGDHRLMAVKLYQEGRVRDFLQWISWMPGQEVAEVESLIAQWKMDRGMVETTVDR
jgi:hypothetical protein